MSSYEILYIDPDEEIPSFTARMKEVSADFLVFVVPQRSLIFSSIITMRLLKKEADRLSKDIFIVTQDEQGVDMAKRVGFIVRKTIDELPLSGAKKKDEEPKETLSFVAPQEKTEVRRSAIPVRGDRPPRSLDSFPVNRSGLQSATIRKELSFSGEETQKESSLKSNTSGVARSVAQALASVSPASLMQQTKTDTVSQQSMQQPIQQPIQQSTQQRLDQQAKSSLMSEGSNVRKRFLESKTEEVDEIGSSVWGGGQISREEKKLDTPIVQGPKKEDKSANQKGVLTKKSTKETQSVASPIVQSHNVQGDAVGSRAQWIVAVSFFIILGMVVSIGMYMQNPEANIVVHTKQQTVSGDASYLASADSVDAKALFLEYEDTVTKTGDATGAGSSSGAKAHGTVILYNNFSSEDQPLVATTRIQSPDGKIFRITKSVTIPGTQQKDGKTEPGQIVVDVQADQPGEEYNIPAGKFTIPGFAGGPKAEAIYAESTDPMIGGGVTDEKNRVVSQNDINEVKKKIEKEEKAKAIEKSKTDMEAGITAEDIVEVTFLESTPVPTIGTATKSFDLTAKVRVRYAVFSDQEARKSAIQSLMKGVAEGSSVSDWQSAKIDYGKMTADFDKKTIDVKMFVSGDTSSEIPLDAIRQDILGKNESELQAVIEKYPQISGFEVEIRKSYFEKRIPTDPNKVHIEVVK